MTSAKQHYDQLLGEHYTWFAGGAGDPFERSAAWLTRHGLAAPVRTLDLGAGFGAHAVPLARLGAEVTAVDFHAGLLAELRAAAPTVVTHEADVLDFLAAAHGPWDAILCLGDTLTHLPERSAVQRLLADAARLLVAGGHLALGYRDYSGPPRTGLERFIPVRSDTQRSMLCCIDPIDADRISVTDIITIAEPAGLRTRLSSYEKLRLAPAAVAAWAATAGLTLERSAVDQGVVLQVLRAPG